MMMKIKILFISTRLASTTLAGITGGLSHQSTCRVSRESGSEVVGHDRYEKLFYSRETWQVEMFD